MRGERPGVDLRNIEDVDGRWEQTSAACDLSLVVLSGSDDGRRDGKFRYPLKDVLWRILGKVCDQLVVDR